ncbi:hypothetical protein G6011_05008 [Alternaria panax]|uniref:Uncharacterized protein n=1 Tax=Alternaria panax TaxID=48097 RepID=A0AAD4I6E4_9PLEO|nr:hypothetical protein G6011_05008 [Alternaria panax]
MARLKEASKQGVARNPPSPSSDDAAATQQLLTESHSPLADLPPPSAVLGASLLNAARVNPASSIPDWMVRKQGLGKLKQVGTKRNDGSRQNLAVRGDPYEIEMSPEKGAYALPEKVNRKPLRILKKRPKPKKKVIDVSSEAPVASSELPVHHQGEVQVVPQDLVENLALAEGLAPVEPEIRSSPPPLVPPENDTIAVDTTRLEIPPTVVDISTDPSEDHADTQASSKRTSESHHSKDRPAKYQREQRQAIAESVSSRRAHPQVRIPVRRKLQEQDTTKKADHSNYSQEAQAIADYTVQEEESRPRRAVPKPRSKRKRANDTTAASQQLPVKKRGSQGRAESSKEASETANAVETESAPALDEPEHESEHELDIQASESIADEGDEFIRPTGQPGSIETVFEFLNLEARPGKCQTKVATSINRKCNVYSVHLQDNDVTTEQVAEDANEIKETLRQIGTSVQEKDRRAFKGDAYGHVFRALTLYLEALYIWLNENDGTVIESLDAMRILSPLIHQILAFKDTIADWNVFVPKSFKGDRIIKDVDVSLIARLRQVEKTYRNRLSRLEAKELHREQQADFERKMKDKEEEEDRKARSFEARTEWWKRWQDLHIKRMLCEPDPRRRQKLTITRFGDLEERDANGVVFERLPVFKSRSAPPHRQASTLDDSPEWTDQEETALIDGLQHCAGPQIFEKIFTTYCRPSSSHPLGGHLRERSVAEIVTRAAQLRSDLQKLYRDNGWVVEDWITKIPVMP